MRDAFCFKILAIARGLCYNVRNMLPTDLTGYKGKRICVALSGGVDSVCLLHCLLQAAEPLNLTLSALTCEHGIRGEESLRDLAFVRELCEKWRVPLTVYTADIPARAAASGRGFEEEGREFRYACFRETLETGAADCVATAHHRDDFAETALFRLARGTSLAGLSAIGERDGIIRPFLSVTRAEIERYAAENELPFVTDSSNSDEAFARNAIRHSVMPALERTVNGASRHLTEFALRAAEDDRLLQELARKEVRRQGDWFFVPVRLPAPLFSRACLFAVRSLGGEKNYTSANVAEIARLKELQSGRRASLPFGLTAVREGGEIAIGREKAVDKAELPFREGAFELNGYKCRVSFVGQAGALHADYDAFPAGAVVRTRREGDYIVPFKGTRKSLKEYFTDKKIPARAGRELPLVAAGSEVFAVFGVEISDGVKVTEQTARTAYLVCET